MKYIQGQNRAQTQLFPISLDEAIDPGNEVRIIDLFVGSLALGSFGFKVEFTKKVKLLLNTHMGQSNGNGGLVTSWPRKP